jgi:hypothetical protein
MDLLTIAQALTATQVVKNTPAEVKALMPTPVITKYANVLETPPPLRFFHVQSRNLKDQWVLTYSAEFPMGFTKSVIPTEMSKFAIDYIKNNTEPQDMKYLEIFHVFDKTVQVRFDAAKWMKDNFPSSGKYMPPASLEWHYSHDIPRIVFVNAQAVAIDLIHYLESEFLIYIKKNPRHLFNEHWKFLQKITPDLFDFKLDRINMKMKAHLKYSVILGSLALYTALYNKDSFTKSQFDQLKKKASAASDVTHLDKFLKNYK